MRTGRGVVGVAAGLLAAGFLLGCTKKGEPTGGGESPPTQPTPPPVPVVAIPPTFTEYMKDVATNPEAARAKHADKTVEVAGVPTGVSLTSRGMVAITFTSPELPPTGIVCRTANHAIIGDVVPGRGVRLKGRVDASRSGAELTDAEVIEVGPDTAVRMSADDLAKAAAADLNGLKDRCAGKAVVVTGTFAGLRKDGPSQQEFAELKVAGQTRVLCIHAEGYRYQLTEPGEKRRFNLKEGDAICWVGVVNTQFTEPGQIVLEECIPKQ